jgi:hypothetical protein
MAKEEHPKTIPVYNRGGRTFHTSQGHLGPGKTQHLPEKEAEGLLGYEDLLDARKIVEPADLKAELKNKDDEIAALKTERDTLLAEVEKLKKK